MLTLYSENDASDSINTINFLTAKTHLSNMRTTDATAQNTPITKLSLKRNDNRDFTLQKREKTYMLDLF